MKFIFQGASDDTFGEVFATSDDFDNCASGEPIRYQITAPDGSGVLVTGQYAPDPAAGWLIGVATLDEDKSLDKWQFVSDPGHNGYQGQLEILAPEGSELKCLERGV